MANIPVISTGPVTNLATTNSEAPVFKIKLAVKPQVAEEPSSNESLPITDEK